MQEFFEFSLGARVLYKSGLTREMGPELERLGGKRAFIIADRGVVAAGLLEHVLVGVGESVEVVGTFDNVPANSSVEVVMAASEQARAAQADLIIAVGGGSPLDTAKCVRIVLKHGGHLLDYQGFNVLEEPLPPMLAIPTTAGTGSEVTPFAVILDEAQNLKMTFASPYLVPTLALLDPLMTRSMPPRLTAATGMDALTHAIETYVSTDNNPISDSLALFAIDMVAANLRQATHHGDDLEARGNMLLASCMAGAAFSNAYLGIVHALAHTIGGKYAVHHGTANAIFLPHGMVFNSEAIPDRFVRIARALGVHTGGRSDGEVIADGIEAVRRLISDCGLPLRLRDVEVPREGLEAIAEVALTDAAIFNNPRIADEADLYRILEAAW